LTILALERYPVAPDAEERFLEFVDVLLSRMRTAGGLLWTDAARAFDDEPSYIVLSEWRSAADLDAWEEGEDARALRDRSDVLLRGGVMRRRFTSS
jgi:heme-degrading monooxygenase HmoA